VASWQRDEWRVQMMSFGFRATGHLLVVVKKPGTANFTAILGYLVTQ
jgi:hypothetical protein